MARYNKLFSDIKFSAACLLVGLLAPTIVWAADNTSADFSAQISDGSCELTLSDSSLTYGIYRVTQMQSASAVAMLPLMASLRCSGATTPTLSVSGTVYSPVSVTQPVIFRNANSTAGGVGFMVRRNTGSINLSNFYNINTALKNNSPVALSAVAEQVMHNEPLLLGLVRAGSEPVTPGTVNATLTFKVTYE